jgi:hypothetical protein
MTQQTNDQAKRLNEAIAHIYGEEVQASACFFVTKSNKLFSIADTSAAAAPAMLAAIGPFLSEQAENVAILVDGANKAVSKLRELQEGKADLHV